MKVVHKNADVKEVPGNWLDKAKAFEASTDTERAAAAYEKAIKDNPLNEYAYDRLMIIYRKNKEYKKENAVIARAIK